MHKYRYIIAIVVIGALIVVGVTAFWLSSSLIESLTSKEEFEASSELSVYRYEQGAIEFKYPANLSLTSKEEFEASSELSVYRYEQGAIEFKYPANLSLTDYRWYEGISPTQKIGFPVISLEKETAQSPTRGGLCSKDCIHFRARSQEYAPEYSGEETQIPGRYVFQDEHESKPFKIGNLEAVRHYAVDTASDFFGMRQIGYSLEDRTYLKDPYLPDRWMAITYYERIRKLPKDPRFLTREEIKALFDKDKYRTFQDIVESFRFLHTDTNKLRKYANQELGISFEYPAYWGYVTEKRYGTSLADTELTRLSPDKLKAVMKYRLDTNDSEQDELYLDFMNPLGVTTSHVEFEVHSSRTISRHVHDYSQRVASRSFFQYIGQPLDNACKNNAYLNTLLYEAKLTGCYPRTLPNGVKLVIFEGSFAKAYSGSGPSDLPIGKNDKYQLSEYGLELIPPEKREFTDFKAAILSTKSSSWPGVTIYVISDSKTDAKDKEIFFDEIISSLMKMHLIP